MKKGEEQQSAAVSIRDNEEREEAYDSQTGFLQCAVDEIQHRESLMSRSTIENYRTVIRSLADYLGGDIAVGEVNGELFRGYENWLQAKGIQPNSISCYMRSLRALTGSICGTDAKDYFHQVFTGRAKTDKRALEEGDIDRIRELRLARHTFLSLARDLFLFSFYALGMPFVDMAFLCKNQVRKGQIIYFRHKTRQRICIPLEPCMEEIICRYDQPGRDYVFPLLTTSNPDEAYHEYQMMINHYNRALKQLAKKAGINHNLTSYVSRHSWASMAFSSNVDLPVISKALGHVNPQNTLVYIKEINDERLTEANRKILEKFGEKDE